MVKITKLFFATIMSIALFSTSVFAGNYGKDKQAKAEHQDIVDVAVANGSFNTLATLLTTAGLVDTLKGDGPFTVFAPTDEAFSKLPAETIADLQKPENLQMLKDILTYHVVSGKVKSGDLSGKKLSPTTVQGTSVDIDATGSMVKVDNATVTMADIMGKNGVIHVVDAVLMP